MTKIHFIGTSSGFATANRNPSCLVFDSGNAKILLDCGDGATRALLQQGVDLSELDGAVVTHMHPDHSGGLAFFVQTLHLLKRERPFKLFMPSEAVEIFPRMLVHHYMFPSTLGFELNISSILPDKRFRIGDVEIVAHPNRHMLIHELQLPDHPQLKGEAFCLSLEAEGKCVAYSSDIFALSDLEFTDGGDLLVIEAMHIDLDELPRFLENRPFDKVVLTHIPDERGELARRDSSGWLWAKDGMEVVV